MGCALHPGLGAGELPVRADPRLGGEVDAAAHDGANLGLADLAEVVGEGAAGDVVAVGMGRVLDDVMLDGKIRCLGIFSRMAVLLEAELFPPGDIVVGNGLTDNAVCLFLAQFLFQPLDDRNDDFRLVFGDFQNGRFRRSLPMNLIPERW